ncbi:uncharacterized protein N7500_001876, partial [Penicillium coprophilum]|uniref:uncharacterized protein n=1 Tax=Penicillium coprophilum TaxID=36646 RepID=UPI0023947260
MPNPGKKRAAEWCTFCEMGGHTREECRRWAACLRDTVVATHAAIAEAHKPPQPRTNPNKKTRRGHRGGSNRQDRKFVRHNAAPPASPSSSSPSCFLCGGLWTHLLQAQMYANLEVIIVNTTTSAQGSPRAGNLDLLLRIGQVSQSEVDFLVQALKEFRERSAREDFVEKPLIEDEPYQKEFSQGPNVQPGSDDELD